MTTQSPKKAPSKKPAPKKPAAKKAASAKASSPITNAPPITIDLAAIGRWCYILGVLLAVVIALLPSDFEPILWFVYPMILFGLVAGIFHFTWEEEKHFFLLAISMASFQSIFQGFFQTTFNSVPTVGDNLFRIFNILTFFLTAILVVIIIKNVVRWSWSRQTK